MTKLNRVVRFELMKDGEFHSLFRSGLVNYWSAGYEVYSRYSDAIAELDVPPLNYIDNNYVFYFTRRGLRKFKAAIALLKQMLDDGVTLVIRRAWNLGGLHTFIDDYQVVVQM